MAKSKKEKADGNCLMTMLPIRDALDVISGKWKIMILISIKYNHKRFSEIEKSIPKITSKVLAKELKDLEQHKLIKRTVYDDYPVVIEYTLTDYASTLQNVMNELYKWGVNHRKKITGK